MNKSKNKGTRILIFSLLGLIALLSILKVSGVFKGNLLEVTSTEVERRDIIEIVSASGRVQPEQEVIISPDVSGEIISLNVKEGDRVREGQLLIKIQPDIYEAGVTRARAALNNSHAQYNSSMAAFKQAKARWANAQKTFERNKELLAKEIISKADYDLAEMDYLVAEQQLSAAKENLEATRFNIKSAEANVKEAEDRLARTEIFSPITGTVASLEVEAGERVVGTSQMAGTELMRIADLEQMEVLVEVSEIDIPRIDLNDSARIELDAYPGKLFRGQVTEIARSANGQSGAALNNQSSNFEVKIRILRDSYTSLLEGKDSLYRPFMPGMSALVEIISEFKTDVLAVPVLAVGTYEPKSDKGNNTRVQEIVYIIEEGKAHRKEVSIGIQDDSFLEILDGLEEGMQIVSGPYEAISIYLKDGKEVEVKASGRKKRD